MELLTQMKTDKNRNARVKLLVDELYQGSQKRFARLVSVSEPTVSAWITGDHGLRRSTLVRIAQALKGRVNEKWLVDGVGEPGLVHSPNSQFAGYAAEVAPLYNPVPQTKETKTASLKEKITLFFDRKIAKTEAQTEAKKEALRELKEETLRELVDFLGFSE